ncbi:MAG: hypothetical protein AAFZ18_33945 [Myxococcota bacterium]
MALRVSREIEQRARFNEEQLTSYAAGALPGRVVEEGAVEPLIRGDAVDDLIEGAARNGPLSEEDLAALARGVMDALETLPKGHGDLVPSHILVAEDGAIHLLDAAPDTYALAPSLPGREVLPEYPRDPRASDRWALRETLRRLWQGARLPDEEPPGWVRALGETKSLEEARALVEAPSITGSAARGLRARLLSRLCPERRRAWEELTGASGVPAPRSNGTLESAFSLEPTRVDVAQLSVDPAFVGLSQDLKLEGLQRSDASSPPPLVGGAVEPPSLGLSTESLVPTQVVRERGRPSERPSRPTAQAPVPIEAPTYAAAPPTTKMPARPAEAQSPAPEDDDEGLVLPVPDEELGSHRSRGLAVILGVAALGITVVAGLLALGQLPLP